MNAVQKPKAQAAQEQIEELLCLEGVLAKGYGCVAKFAMQDPQLPTAAKGLYAYLCSLTGCGTVTYPLRDNILISLQFCKTSYYNALYALIDSGYISVARKRMNEDKWERNVYTIVSNPKRFLGVEPKEEEPQQVRFKGMLSGGYGIIPRLVMQDQRMSIKVKALYAYLICYADAGTAAFPKSDMIRRHLGISPSTFQTYMNTLERLGYIVKKQRRENGRFGVVDYYICEQPELKKRDTEKWDNSCSEPPLAEKQDTKKQDNPPSQNPPCEEKSDMVFSDIGKSDTGFSDIEKSDMVSSDVISRPTSLSKPSVISKPTGIYSHRVSTPTPAEEEDHPPHGEAAVEKQSIREAMLAANGIPWDYLRDKEKMISALRVSCDYFTEFPASNDPTEQRMYDTVFDALCRLCTQPRSKVRTKYLTNVEVLELLNYRCVEMLPYRADLTVLFEYLVDAYKLALENRTKSSEKPLKNPVAYASYVIWDAMQIYEREEPRLF